MSKVEIILGDCLDVMRAMPDNSVDMVLTSPPYEDARTYSIGFALKGQQYVDWCVDRYLECVRVSRGLVAWVIEGQTRKFRYSATPVLLMADLHRAGVSLRKPPVFHRVGIPGSGGPDWLRNDYEFVVCSTKGKLPWSNNTAMGHPPRWAPGGAMSHRLSSGSRVNQWGHSADSGATVVADDGVLRSEGKRPSHVIVGGRYQFGGTPSKSSGSGRKKNGSFKQTKVQTRRKANGDRVRDGVYEQPVLANPGNVIACKVGGGLMGSKLAHENEAPFPETLANFFIRSFCPPNGVVLDCFGGSGTTGAVALKSGRRAILIDCRESQIDLMNRRVREVQPDLFQ